MLTGPLQYRGQPNHQAEPIPVLSKIPFLGRGPPRLCSKDYTVELVQPPAKTLYQLRESALLQRNTANNLDSTDTVETSVGRCTFDITLREPKQGGPGDSSSSTPTLSYLISSCFLKCRSEESVKSSAELLARHANGPFQTSNNHGITVRKRHNASLNNVPEPTLYPVTCCGL